MEDSQSDSHREVTASSHKSLRTTQLPQRSTRPQRTDPDHLYAEGNSPPQLQIPNSEPRRKFKKASPLPLPSRQGGTVSQSSPSLSPLPRSPHKFLQRQSFHLSSSVIPKPSSPGTSPAKPVDPNIGSQISAAEGLFPNLSGTYLEHKDYAHEPTYFTRPNRFFGPPSTWRSWTEGERTVAASLDRARAMDLSIHLYNAFVLRTKAEKARNSGRGRNRGRNRGGNPNESRSQSRSVSRSASTSRGQSKSKGKGKVRAEPRSDDEMRTDSDDVDIYTSPSRKRRSPSNIRDEPPDNQTFNPPRLWTAWPLPPSEVPREEFLPSMDGINASTEADVYRVAPSSRPRAQLEECLIAIASRISKERWEAREWEDEATNSDDNDERPQKKRRKAKGSRKTQDNDIQMFSSQMFTSNTVSDSVSDPDDHQAGDDTTSTHSAASKHDSSDSSSHSTQRRKPVVMADDAQIHELLLPSTRHVISQLDRLLGVLHTVQQAAHKRKTVNFGARGADEVLGLAGVVFGEDIVGRARARWERLLDGVE